ncbi:MAG: hypothetical protein AAGB26_02945 [Planctomycetota bacterium]
MIRWEQYIQMLEADGVSLEQIDLEGISESGERRSKQCLVRWIDGVPIYLAVHIPDIHEPVSRRTLRQVANALRLPPEKYIFPEEMN